MNPFSLLVNKSNPLAPDYIPKELARPNIPFAEERAILESGASTISKNETLTASKPEMFQAPAAAAPVPEKFLMDKTAASYLELLFERGRSQGVFLYGVSGYRSYARQKAIYEESVRKNGAAHAAKYIAPPGASEHQSGLAMDVSIPALNFQLEEVFDTTKEGKWLKQFAPLYGFIIRYPKGVSHITGYAYEPWHIRFVTKPLAIYLSKTHLTLEEYHGLSKPSDSA